MNEKGFFGRIGKVCLYTVLLLLATGDSPTEPFKVLLTSVLLVAGVVLYILFGGDG